MVQVAIVEDEKAYSDILLQYLAQYEKDTGAQLNTTVYTNGLDFLDEASRGFDIVFLDISLPAMNGMEVAGQFRQVDSTAILIFVTQMAQYAVKGYEVDAIDYIVKPVSYAHFFIKLNKACRLLSERAAWYMVPTTDGMVRLQLSDIYYIESQKHYMVFYTTHGDYRARITMTVLERYLKPHCFARPSNSFLLNLKYVQTIQRNSVDLRGRRFSITRAYKKQFLDELTQCLGGRIIHD